MACDRLSARLVRRSKIPRRTAQLEESDYWREQFQTISEDVSVRNVLMHSAHQRFYDDAQYKLTFYLLTYLFTGQKAQLLQRDRAIIRVIEYFQVIQDHSK